jgi:hypothetical protein
MNDLRQAAQQALKCIERLNAHGWILADYEDEVYAAIAALKAALEQPEQEPVAYLCENGVGHRYFRWKKPSDIYKPIALYTAPPAAQPEQRPWQGLTDEEQRELHKEYEMDGWGLFYDAIEAALRSKNK